jgi:murein DD-endopeptidase MepM/ murein hydrolase activator NlpD
LLPFNQKPSSQPKKNWNDAVRHYNLPVNGIEVVIPGDYKPKAGSNAQQRHKPRTDKKPLRHERKVQQKQSTGTSASPLRKSFRYIITRSALLACGLATLGNIPVYSMIHDTNREGILDLTDQPNVVSPGQVVKDLNLPAVAVESFAGFPVDALPDAQQGNWTMRSVLEEDTLDSILSTLDLTTTAKKMLDNSSIKQELKNLAPNSHLLVQVVEGRLLQLIYAKDPAQAYIVSATDKGYIGKWEKNVFEERNSKLAFTVEHSILRDGKTAGLSSSVIRQLSEVFAKDADFKHVRVGDKVGVIFEDFHYQGESIYTDKVVAAEYTTKSKTYQRIRYTLADGKTDYFTPDAATELKRAAFNRQPVEGARISSGFGFRIHPIFGFRKAHTGVDFAAPYGTPIHATADGVVKTIGRQNGYGNVVELRHIDGISTLYGHMSGFMEGLKAGDTVARGDVIGYVGSTGTSTGNHVHYEYRVEGEPIDPQTAELPTTGLMSEKESHQFKEFASNMVAQLTDLRKVASLGKPLKATTGGG